MHIAVGENGCEQSPGAGSRLLSRLLTFCIPHRSRPCPGQSGGRGWIYPYAGQRKAGQSGRLYAYNLQCLVFLPVEAKTKHHDIPWYVFPHLERQRLASPDMDLLVQQATYIWRCFLSGRNTTESRTSLVATLNLDGWRTRDSDGVLLTNRHTCLTWRATNRQSSAASELEWHPVWWKVGGRCTRVVHLQSILVYQTCSIRQSVDGHVGYRNRC